MKTNQEKDTLHRNKQEIWLMVGLSSETIEQEYNTLLKTQTLKFKKDHQPKILYVVKISFKSKIN